MYVYIYMYIYNIYIYISYARCIYDALQTLCGQPIKDIIFLRETLTKTLRKSYVTALVFAFNLKHLT